MLDNWYQACQPEAVADLPEEGPSMACRCGPLRRSAIGRPRSAEPVRGSRVRLLAAGRCLLGPLQPVETVLGNGLMSELPGRSGCQGRERAVDPRLDIAVALLLVFAGLEQALQLVGVAGATAFPRPGGLVLSHGGRDHVRHRGWETSQLIPRNLLITRAGDVVLGQVRDV